MSWFLPGIMEQSMTIFGYKIQRNASLRTNPFSILLLIMIVGTFYMAANESGYFAAYRFGNSIIPRENQLIKSGPYVMQSVRVRNGYLVNFRPISGGVEYSEKWDHFDDINNILGLVRKLQNQPMAYLWQYPDNPVRKVWKIEVDQQTVLSYKSAMYQYRFDSKATYYLGSIVIFFVLFLLSMISIDRVSSGTLAKKTPVSDQNELRPSYRRLFWSSVIFIVSPLMVISFRCLDSVLPFSRSTNSSLSLTWFVLWSFTAIFAILVVLVQSGRVKSEQTSNMASFLVSMSVIFLFAILFVEIKVGSSYVQHTCPARVPSAQIQAS
jgi:hypothetical protein